MPKNEIAKDIALGALISVVLTSGYFILIKNQAPDEALSNTFNLFVYWFRKLYAGITGATNEVVMGTNTAFNTVDQNKVGLTFTLGK